MSVGFSVSGSAAIIFAAMFIGFGMFHSATVNGFESVSEAQEDRTDRTLTRQNTEIVVTSAVWNPNGNGNLVVEVDNTGSTQLSVSDVDVLADNSYQSGYITSVDGDESTDLWLSEETLNVTVTSLGSSPGQVKVVSGPGVADTAVVT